MSEQRFRLYDAAALAPVIQRMARQVLALLDETPTVMVGVLRRGVPPHEADFAIDAWRQGK